MAIQSLPDSLTEWQAISAEEEETGQIPVPAVDYIVLNEHEPPSILLVDPTETDDERKAFVRLDAMPPADRVALQALLDALGAQSHLDGELVSVWHLGGLDYQFCTPGPQKPVRLKSRLPAQQLRLWGILRGIALLCARYETNEILSRVVERP